MKKTRKAFTLVELLVVIAILAVLATVGIVGYTSFTKKAKESNDKSVIAQINLALQSSETTDGQPKTMYEALQVVKECGYDISKMTPDSDKCDYVYDMTSNRFALMKGTDVLAGPTDKTFGDEGANLWQFIEVNGTLSTTRSNYLKNGAWNSTTINASTGVDCGDNTSIASISYSNSSSTSNAIIRTSSYTTNLTINTKGSVTHYGEVGKLTVEEVAMASFHEYGKARTVSIEKGNFVIEEGAVVTLVSVTATAADQVTLNIKGTLDVVAGDTTKYEVTSSKQAQETVDAPIADDTLALVNGVAKTSLTASDFADGSKVVLLKDFDSTQVTLGSCTVIGNLTKLNASITGNKEITLKNIHTTKITISNFTGTLTLDGGLLETSNVNDQNAAVLINNGYGTYVFKNMVVAANTNKAIKISCAKSVTIENCEFDAAKLDSSVDTAGQYTGRSLAAIDIQEQNNKNGTQGKMTVVIRNCYFSYVPQGSITGNVADSDTAGAIKIKTESAVRSAGFEKVVITGNTFVNCYRDVVVGCNVYETTTATKEQADMDAAGNVVASPIWEVSNNNTTLTADVVANRATLTYYKNSNLSQSIAEKVGRIEGGCALFETARSARSWLN